MSENRRKFDPEFRACAIRIVRETGKPIAQVARDLGVNEGTLGNWCREDAAQAGGAGGLSADDRAELARLRSENAELRMERDVLKRSVVLWVLSRVRDNTHYVEGRVMPSRCRDRLVGKGSVVVGSA